MLFNIEVLIPHSEKSWFSRDLLFIIKYDTISLLFNWLALSFLKIPIALLNSKIFMVYSLFIAICLDDLLNHQNVVILFSPLFQLCWFKTLSSLLNLYKSSVQKTSNRPMIILIIRYYDSIMYLVTEVSERCLYLVGLLCSMFPFLVGDDHLDIKILIFVGFLMNYCLTWMTLPPILHL